MASRAWFKSRWEQYKQSWLDFKNSVAVDTITTRFLLLFLFLLVIPLVTVIIFTSTLLARHIDDIANIQLAISQNFFDAQTAQAQEKLALLASQTPMGKTAISTCPSQGVDVCLSINPNTQQVMLPHQPPLPLSRLKAEAPDLTPALDQPARHPHFFARWRDQLYLFGGQPAVRSPVALLGFVLDNAFLNQIYRQQPNLQTEIWILAEPIQPTSPQWIARSPKSRGGSIPVAQILARTAELNLNIPATIELDRGTYRVLQEPIYAADNHPIARVIHILPLAPSQVLLTNYYWGIYVISVASLIFSVLLAMLAGRTITQPLLKLIRQVSTLSRENMMRNPTEVSVSGVNEIRQLGETFNRMVARLRQEHKMKDEFVATLTHDLKVPLLAEKQTLAYFKTHAYGPLSPEQSEVLDVLQSSNSSCLALVNGLLEVYRYDSGEVVLLFEQFNLQQLLEETVNELRSLAQEKHIELAVKNDLAESSDAALVYADRLELKRVLHNLVSNAITNTPLHGVVQCRITNAQHHGSDTVYKVGGFQHTTLKYPIKLIDKLLIIVQDSGVGFSSEDLPYLFKQFAASRGRNPMSIGLGLYNCYQVVQAHNGVLWVESTEGEGSIVSFVLPQNQEAAADRRIYHDRRRYP